MAAMTHVWKTNAKFWKHARSDRTGEQARTKVGNSDGLCSPVHSLAESEFPIGVVKAFRIDGWSEVGVYVNVMIVVQSINTAGTRGM